MANAAKKMKVIGIGRGADTTVSALSTVLSSPNGGSIPVRHIGLLPEGLFLGLPQEEASQHLGLFPNQKRFVNQ
jgi:hypothetical protein